MRDVQRRGAGDPSDQSGLEVISERDGSLTLGWVGDSVYYVRFVGGLSASLGAAHVARLREVLAASTSLAYFSDSSALAHYDLLARSAFVRLILEHRKKFAPLVMLTWPDGGTAGTEAFVAAVGGVVTVLTDPAEFDELLLRAAPLAKHLLNPKRGAAGTAPTPPRS